MDKIFLRSLLIAASIWLMLPESGAFAADSKTYTGIIRTGLMAIGGETTGAEIAAQDRTWELEYRTKPELAAVAEKLNGQNVVVTGIGRCGPGVEVRERCIITVETLTAAE